MNGAKHLVLDRRKFLGVAAGLVAAGVMPKSALALAAPYSFKQGAYDVTVVSDGTLQLPITVIFPEAKPEDLKTCSAPWPRATRPSSRPARCCSSREAT